MGTECFKNTMTNPSPALTEQTPQWLVAQVLSTHSFKLLHRLNQHGVEAYLPVFTETGYRGALKQIPLFPGYMFVRPKSAAEATSVLRFGAWSFVSATRSGPPATISEEDVNLIKGMSVCDGVVQEGSRFALGEQVRVIDGPFAGFAGRIISLKKDTAKVAVPPNIVDFLQSNLESLKN